MRQILLLNLRQQIKPQQRVSHFLGDCNPNKAFCQSQGKREICAIPGLMLWFSCQENLSSKQVLANELKSLIFAPTMMDGTS